MAFIPIAAGHVSARNQKTVIDSLRERGALGRETAQPLPDLSSWQRRRVDRLLERGVIRPGARDRYYLDQEALQELQSRQWALAFSVAVVAAGIGAAWLLI